MIPENQVEWIISAGREQPAPDEPRRIMNTKPTFEELWALIDGLDEDFHDWQAVRRLKVVGHTLAKEAETTA